MSLVSTANLNLIEKPSQNVSQARLLFGTNYLLRIELILLWNCSFIASRYCRKMAEVGLGSGRAKSSTRGLTILYREYLSYIITIPTADAHILNRLTVSLVPIAFYLLWGVAYTVKAGDHAELACDPMKNGGSTRTVYTGIEVGKGVDRVVSHFPSKSGSSDFGHSSIRLFRVGTGQLCVLVSFFSVSTFLHLIRAL